MHKDDYAAWLDQLRREGATWAAGGSEVGTLIARALGFMNAVRRAVLADRLAPDEARALSQEIDALQTEVLAELVSGYFQGQEKRADEQRLALEELAALFKINSAANSTLDFDQVLDLVVEHVTAAMHSDICSLFIYEPEIDRLVLRATRGLTPDAVGQRAPAPGRGRDRLGGARRQAAGAGQRLATIPLSACARSGRGRPAPSWPCRLCSSPRSSWSA